MNAVVGDLAARLARQKAEEALKKLEAGKGFADALPAEEDKGKKGAEPVKLGGQIVKADETGPFTIASSPTVPRLGSAPDLFADAMKAAAGQEPGHFCFDVRRGAVLARDRGRLDELRPVADDGEHLHGC